MASRQYGPFDHEDDFHPKKFPDDWDDQEQVEQRAFVQHSSHPATVVLS